MKIKYTEQYSTCIFFTRMCSYSIVGNDDDLVDKVDAKIQKLGLHLFFEDKSKINKLSLFLEDKLSPISWIFKLPFFTPLWVSNPRKMYQIWCEEINGYFTDEEKRKIIDEDIAAGSERVFWGETLWILMNMQKRYVPILFEIDYLIRHSFYKKD